MAQAVSGRQAPNARFLRTDGREVELADLIGGRPTVLFFLRHYG